MTTHEDRAAEVVRTDVLVLGGGVGGCFAAIKAAESGLDVVVVDKGNTGRSGYSPMMSGVLSCFDAEKDDYAAWCREAVRTGEWLNDQKRLQLAIRETGGVIKRMDDWGVRFQKDAGGYVRRPASGSLNVCNVLMTNSGFQMMSILRGEVLRRGVRLCERVMVTDLLTSDGEAPTGGRIVGAVGFNIRNGSFHVFEAKATVICTGAATSTRGYAAQRNLSGDGKAMAFRAGCEMRNLDFIRWIPSAAGQSTSAGQNILCGEGAVFINAGGERFLKKWDPERMERAPRALVGRAIYVEETEGRGPVCLDATHLDEAAYSRVEKCIPVVMRNLAARGLDLRRDRIPYTNFLSDIGGGGIRVDEYNAATVPGLYAVGDASDCAEGGVSSIITAGMAAATGGWRAGEAAGRYCAEVHEAKADQAQVGLLKDGMYAPLKRHSGLACEEVGRHYAGMVDRGLLGPAKSESKLRKAIGAALEVTQEEIPDLVARDYHELARCIGLMNEVLVLGELYARCSLARTESRGSHYREDYPRIDDKNWLRWVIARQEAGAVRVWSEPVPFEQYDLRPETAG